MRVSFHYFKHCNGFSGLATENGHSYWSSAAFVKSPLSSVEASSHIYPFVYHFSRSRESRLAEWQQGGAR